jgi:hypothetical protein
LRVIHLLLVEVVYDNRSVHETLAIRLAAQSQSAGNVLIDTNVTIHNRSSVANDGIYSLLEIVSFACELEKLRELCGH